MAIFKIHLCFNVMQKLSATYPTIFIVVTAATGQIILKFIELKILDLPVKCLYMTDKKQYHIPFESTARLINYVFNIVSFQMFFLRLFYCQWTLNLLKLESSD